MTDEKSPELPHDTPLPDDDPRESPDEVRRAAVRKRVRSLVYATYVAFAVAFILLSTKSLFEGVFHLDPTPVGASKLSPAAKECAEGIRSLAAALDRGMTAAAGAHDGTFAGSAAWSTANDESARFQAALRPEWDGQARLAAVCASEPRGADAFAALLRLRRAEEGFLVRRVAEIAALRRDVEAYLPR